MSEPQPAAAVAFEQVGKRYGTTVAVDRVDLTVDDGEFFTMLGPSGSGKTTCLRLVAGFERPTTGRVLLHGHDVTDRAPFERDVNTVFQDYALFPHLSVADNIGYGLMVKKIDKAKRADRVADALAMVRLPVDEYGGRRPSQLSGGQRQRVALARALVNRPSVLLLDEPLGALDLKLRQEMQSELKRIQREVGITFVFVTHDQEEALTMSDRIAVFNNGRIEQIGQPSEIYDRPSTGFVAGFVGTSNLLEGPVAHRLTGSSETQAVRPEKILLRRSNGFRNDAADAVADASTDESPSRIVAVGTISDVEFLGTFIRYRIDLGDVEFVAVRQNDPAAALDPLAVGDPVEASWPAEAMRVLRSNGDPTAVPDEPTGSARSPRLQERQP